MQTITIAPRRIPGGSILSSRVFFQLLGTENLQPINLNWLNCLLLIMERQNHRWTDACVTYTVPGPLHCGFFQYCMFVGFQS
jgi:hypothetical protein